MSKKKTAKERDSLKAQLVRMASDPNSPGSDQAKRAAEKLPAKKKAASKKSTARSAATKISKTTKVNKKVAKPADAPDAKSAEKPEVAAAPAGGNAKTSQSESNNTTVQRGLQDREAQAIQLVERFAKGAMVPGAIPIPLVDAAVISGVQLKMLHSLCKIYQTPFSSEIGRSAIASFAGGAGSAAFGVGAGTVVRMLLKSLPLVGLAVGMAGISGFGYATTYAIGKVFVEHFEGGGTLLTFHGGKASAVSSKEPGTAPSKKKPVSTRSRP